MMSNLIAEERLLDYEGPISFQVKKELLDRFRSKLNPDPAISALRKRCIYVLEELLTNTHEYYKKRELTDEHIKVELIRVKNDDIEIRISNTIFRIDTDETVSRINSLNGKNTGELKNCFQETMQQDQGMQEGNGLGLITVKLKTGTIYRMQIVEKNTQENILCLTTTLNQTYEQDSSSGN